MRTKTAIGERKKTVFVHRWALFGGLSADAIFIRVHTISFTVLSVPSP